MDLVLLGKAIVSVGMLCVGAVGGKVALKKIKRRVGRLELHFDETEALIRIPRKKKRKSKNVEPMK
jgi:hypothetical protein